jgi:AcrR family transcriptional regulator
VASEPEEVEATDGRVPGRRGLATRQRLLESTAELLSTTSWRAIKVIDIAREAGTSPATFYQYFENVERAILVLAEELVEDAAVLVEAAEGPWRGEKAWDTAVAVVEGFMDYWERHRAVLRVLDLATDEGDRRFQAMRVRALNAVTVTLSRVLTTTSPQARQAPPADAMATASCLVSMLAHVAAHRYGFEFWGVRTSSLVESQARILYWSVTGRKPPTRKKDRARPQPEAP